MADPSTLNKIFSQEKASQVADLIDAGILPDNPAFLRALDLKGGYESWSHITPSAQLGPFGRFTRNMFGQSKEEAELADAQGMAEAWGTMLLKTGRGPNIAPPSFEAAQQQNPMAFNLSGIQPPTTLPMGQLTPPKMGDVGPPEFNMIQGPQWSAKLQPPQAKAYMGALENVPGLIQAANMQSTKPIEVSPGATLYDPRSKEGIYTAPVAGLKSVSDENRIALARFKKPYLDLDQTQQQDVNNHLNDEFKERNRFRMEQQVEAQITSAKRLEKEIPKRPTPAQIDDMSEQLTTLAQADNIVQTFDPQFIGPLAGRFGNTKEWLGTLGGKEAEFRSAVARLRNATIKMITGAQMGEREADRIRQELPEFNLKPEAFVARLKLTLYNAHELAQRYRGLLQKSNIDISGLDPVPEIPESLRREDPAVLRIQHGNLTPAQATRAKALAASGATREQIVQTLVQEVQKPKKK